MGRGSVLSLWRGRAAQSSPQVRDWTQQELAQFYRVEWALSQAGISVECDRGLSDEGDPWFAFCRSSDAEVIIHIAREGQGYLLAGFLSGQVQRGRDFGELVERLLAEHPAKSIDKRGQGNVIMHPATMLALLVSIAFLQSNEGKAATADEAVDNGGAVSVVPLVKTVGASRSSGTLASSFVPLVATLELSQAMTILRVASLMNLPVVEHSASVETELPVIAVSRPAPGAHSVATEPASVDKHVLDAHAAAVAGQLAAAPSLAAQTGGVEKLLEIVAKLWTFPDAGFSAHLGFTVAAATAFFSGVAGGTSDAMTIASPAQSKEFSRPHEPQPSELGGEAKPAEHGSSASSLTITQTHGSSESAAQTMLKLSVPGHGETIVHAAALDSSTELYVTVSQLVELAKASISASVNGTVLQDASAPRGGTGALGDPHATELAPHGDKGVADLSPDKAPPAAPKPYTTVVADGVVKHMALDDTAQADVERAIAAFKQDVGHYSIAVNGSDVIFYSPDAVTNHSAKVVVELWQFQDGSSIGLVGLSVDGHLPYSL